MSKISIFVGIALVVLGVGFFIATGSEATTALIPAFLGAAIAACGGLAMKPALRAVFAHLALVLGLLGFLSGLGMGAKTWMGDGLSASAIEQLIMGVVCAGYLFLCIRSFRAARKAKESA